jgi:hypothetical protein
MFWQQLQQEQQENPFNTHRPIRNEVTNYISKALSWNVHNLGYIVFYLLYMTEIELRKVSDLRPTVEKLKWLVDRFSSNIRINKLCTHCKPKSLGLNCVWETALPQKL